MAVPSDRVEAVFNAAIEISDLRARGAYLDRVCRGDGELRARVEALLNAHTAAADFLPLPHSEETIAAPNPAFERPGTMIGRYKLLQQIGEGGFGTVFMAEQEEPVRRRVALKIIKLGMDTRQVVARFEAERQALAMMDHAGIAKVFDAGATGAGRPYFVMELVKGVPITEYCDKNNLTVSERLELFIPVCLAVQHAHQKGLIHRDIKPSNVLVSTQDDRPIAKVIDFGIAKATQSHLTEKTLFTEFRQLIGTPEYMSPEQAEGNLDIDTRSDVYSLGVLLYELLTGTTPHDARELRSKAFAEMQRIIREVEPPKPSTRLSTMKETLPSVAAKRAIEPRKLNALVQGELDWIVMKALEKNRGRRYESPSSLAADLMHHMANEPVTAGAPSRLYRLKKFVRRNRGPVVACAAVFVVLVAGVIGTTVAMLGQKTLRGIAENEKGIAQHERGEAQKQAREAKEQAAVARAIMNFQNTMLSAADPDRMLGEKVTVLQTMEFAAEALDGGDLKDQPLVEAGVRMTIGNTFRELGRYKQAAPHLRKALQLYRSAARRDDSEVAMCLNNLASAIFLEGSATEAEAIFHEALVIRRAQHPPELYDTATVLNNLAVLLRSQKRFLDAEPLLRESLDLRRKVFPAGHRDIALAANNLGTLLCFDLNRLDEAEPLLMEALSILRKGVPPGHSSLSAPLNNLAVLKRARGDLPAAIQLLREAVEINRNVLPKGHPTLGGDVENLALMLKEHGDLEEAEKCYRQALQVAEDGNPPGDPAIAERLQFLADILVLRKNPDEAVSSQKRAIEIYKSAGKSLEAAQGDVTLGRILTARGRFDEAEGVLPAAVEAMAKSLPPGDVELANALNDLASLRLDQGMFDEAEKSIQKSIDISRASGRVGESALARGLSLSGYARKLQGHPDEAEALYRQSTKIRRALPKPQPVEIAQSNVTIASALRERGKLDDAKVILDESYEILTHILPENHPGLATTLSNLATVLVEKDKPDDALPLARQFLLIIESSTDETHWNIGVARTLVARALYGLNQFSDAEKELISAEKILSRAEGVRLGHYEKCVRRLIELYTRWNTAEPGKGYDKKAEEWQDQLPKSMPH